MANLIRFLVDYAVIQGVIGVTRSAIQGSDSTTALGNFTMDSTVITMDSTVRTMDET